MIRIRFIAIFTFVVGHAPQSKAMIKGVLIEDAWLYKPLQP